MDVRRYLSTANRALNFLVGLDGVKYANMLEGASSSYEFLRFFNEASQAEDFATQHPVLEVDDIIVVDNLLHITVKLNEHWEIFLMT